MNPAYEIGTDERSWASAGARAQYDRGVANYKRSLWRLAFLEGALAGGAITTFPVFRFPRPVRVVRMKAVTRGGTAAELAALELAISDVSDRPREAPGEGQIVTDGRFGSSAPFLALQGPQFGWFRVDRLQPHNSQWIWTLSNTGVGAISPVILLEVASATEERIQ